MAYQATSISASLVLVSRDAPADAPVELDQFDPKLIPLDHTRLVIETQQDDISKSFAAIEWEKGEKRWCVSVGNAPPMVRVNGAMVSGERTVLRPDDLITFENSEVKRLLYRFHSPPDGTEPELVVGEAAVKFSGFIPASRKRPRSGSSEDESRVKLSCGAGTGSSVCEHDGDERKGKTIELKDQANASKLEELRRELTCSICKDLLYKTMTLECGHSFCKDCVDEWLARSLTCPMCREVTAKPPFASIVSDKSVEVLISSDDKLKQAFKSKKKQSEARLKKSIETQKKLNKVIMHTKKLGHKLVSIGNLWSRNEQLRFFRGAQEHYGPAREAYCACVSLTRDFIDEAPKAELLVALENLSLEPVDFKKDGEVDVMTAWSKMRTEDLRTRLLMFVKWS